MASRNKVTICFVTILYKPNFLQVLETEWYNIDKSPQVSWRIETIIKKLLENPLSQRDEGRWFWDGEHVVSNHFPISKHALANLDRLLGGDGLLISKSSTTPRSPLSSWEFKQSLSHPSSWSDRLQTESSLSSLSELDSASEDSSSRSFKPSSPSDNVLETSLDARFSGESAGEWDFQGKVLVQVCCTDSQVAS